MPTWYLFLQAATAILSATSIIYAWRSAQQAAAKHAVESVRCKGDALEHRVLQLEESVKHLPTASAVSDISKSVAILLERTEHQEGWIETVAARLDRIDNWLRENK